MKKHLRVLASVLLLSSGLVAGPSQARADETSCDATYSRNLSDLERAIHNSKNIVKVSILFDIPKHGGRYGAVKLIQKLGFLKETGNAVARFIAVDAVGDVVATILAGGLFYTVNKVDYGEYSDAYRVLQEAESGGGAAVEKLHKELAKDNPKWRAEEGMSSEVFRRTIVDLNRARMFCTEFAGDTLDELTQYLTNLSDEDVSYWLKRELPPSSRS